MRIVVVARREKLQGTLKIAARRVRPHYPRLEGSPDLRYPISQEHRLCFSVAFFLVPRIVFVRFYSNFFSISVFGGRYRARHARSLKKKNVAPATVVCFAPPSPKQRQRQANESNASEGRLQPPAAPVLAGARTAHAGRLPRRDC